MGEYAGVGGGLWTGMRGEGREAGGRLLNDATCSLTLARLGHFAACCLAA